MLARNPAGRAPGVSLRLARLFHRTIGQASRAHEVQDTAAQGPAQPGPGRWRPPTAVTVHRTRAGTQERSDHRSVAGVGGQEECHLCLVAGREPCGGLGLLFRVEEDVVTLAARRLPVVAGNARRTDVHNVRSLPGATCGQRAAWMPEERWSDMGRPALEVAAPLHRHRPRPVPCTSARPCARHARIAGGERAAPARPRLLTESRHGSAAHPPRVGEDDSACRRVSVGVLVDPGEAAEVEALAGAGDGDVGETCFAVADRSGYGAAGVVVIIGVLRRGEVVGDLHAGPFTAFGLVGR